MSTILKALKKLERERGDQRSDREMPAMQVFNARQAVGRNARFSWARHWGARWTVAILAAVILTIAGIYLYRSDPIQKHATRTPDAKQAPSAYADTEAGSQVLQASDAVSRAPEQTNGTSFRPADHTPGGTGFGNPAAQVEGSPLPQPSIDPPGASRQAPSESAQPADLLTAPAERIVRPTVPYNGPGPQPTEVQKNTSLSKTETDSLFNRAQRLSDGRLKVQAIAWAPAAEDRMAVINNRVVYEGHAIDDFTIVAIGQDAVVVRENGRMWKVLFGQP